MKLILLSESTYNAHLPQAEVYSFAMNFVINVAYKNGEYYISNNFDDNSTFIEILNLAKSDDCIIFIGFDYDLQGQAMAQAVENNLIRHGIKSFTRTPFFADNYVVTAEAFDISEYLKYLYFNRIFMNKTGSSLRKVLSLEALNNAKFQEFELDNEFGNSTITYICKSLERSV
ncbi:hypothetical protein OFO01_06950 [Campylobacter sp. JMF_01 NE2]|uniref:hypothetical protein n=1 Tax=unclassified Campylobacter TaxID=2593542 RepID=UPI0022E9A9CD|nr:MULTISPECIES: hypothetical protein [unclassified Campylobacter]MDA3053300.1 hypothetical protein [Campylobacter sp. JMF_03 NE3]MDA3067517.1 hypothetical protein [Campylobacter sp. JMF_01 NE2]